MIVGSLILAAISSVGAVLFTTEDNSNKGWTETFLLYSNY